MRPDRGESTAEFRQHLAALREHREALDAWSVFRDWLLSEGYARGELMSLDHQLESERDAPTRQRLEGQRAALLRSFRGTLFGRDGLLADLLLGWSRGFIRSAIVPMEGVHLDCLRELSVHPSGAMLETLECTPRQFAAYLEGGVSPLHELVLRGDAVPNPHVRGSDASDFDDLHFAERRAVLFGAKSTESPANAVELSSLELRVPRMKRLVFTGPLVNGDVAAFSSSTLESLELGHEASLSGLRGILDRCPRLRALHSKVTNFSDVTGLGESIAVALEVDRVRKLPLLELGEFPPDLFHTLEHGLLRVGTVDLREVARVDDQTARRLLLALPRLRGNVEKIQLRASNLELSVARRAQVLEALRRFNQRG